MNQSGHNLKPDGRIVSRRQFLVTSAAAAAGVALAACAGGAQAPGKVDFPAGRPITINVPAGAGGGMDTGCRTLQPFLEKALNTKILPVNNSEGGGQVALSQTVKAKPDGYTLVMIAAPAQNVLWLDARRQPDFKRKSFVFLANQVWDPAVIVAKADAPWKNINELVQAGKDKPDTIAVGSSGTDDQFFVLDIMYTTGAKWNLVANADTATALPQLLGGHIQACAFNEAEMLPLVKKGDVKILGVANATRTKTSPDVPTFKELGIDMEVAVWRGYGAPAGIPQAILDILGKGFQDAINDPEHLTKMGQIGHPVAFMNSADFTSRVIQQDTRISQLAKKFGLFEPVPQD